MDKKYFDKRLYLNGLKQLRLIGIIFCILSVLGTALPVFMMIQDVRRSEAMGYQVNYTSISSMTILLIFIMFLAPFIMGLVQFSFLNNRKGSDFYHSLPNTRTSVFMSFTASILTWVYATIILSMLASVLVYVLFGAVLNFNLVPYLLVTYLSGATLVTAITLLAMSITGTLVTNIVVFGLILYLPRMITMMFSTVVTSTLRIVTANQFGMLGNSDYNIPFKFTLTVLGVIQPMGGHSYSESLYTSTGAIVYSLVLAVLYLAAACLFFTLRKSETAGKSAPNRILQHVYRCAITLPVTLILPYSYVATLNNTNYWENNRSMVIAVVVISLIIYFLFELISTKKLKNLLKATPVLLVLVAINLIFGYSVTLTRDSILNTKPKASDIENVSVSPFSYTTQYYDDRGNRLKSYTDLSLTKLTYKDPELLDAVSSALSDSIAAIKGGWGDRMQLNYTVKIKLKTGRTIERRIAASSVQSDTIVGVEQSNQAYIHAMTSFPSDKQVNKISVSDLPEKDAEAIWKSYQLEYNKLSLSKKLELSDYMTAMSSGNGVNFQFYDIFNVYGSVGVTDYMQMYAITEDFPQTFELYMKLQNQNSKAKTVSNIERILNGESVGYSYSVTLLNPEKLDDVDLPKTNGDGSTVVIAGDTIDFNQYASNSKDSKYDVSTENDKKVFSILLRQTDNTTIYLSKPLLRVVLTFYDKNYTNSAFYLNINEENLKDIINIDQGSQYEKQ